MKNNNKLTHFTNLSTIKKDIIRGRKDKQLQLFEETMEVLRIKSNAVQGTWMFTAAHTGTLTGYDHV